MGKRKKAAKPPPKPKSAKLGTPPPAKSTEQARLSLAPGCGRGPSPRCPSASAAHAEAHADTIPPRLLADVVFDCLFCGHEATCECFIDKVRLLGVRDLAPSWPAGRCARRVAWRAALTFVTRSFPPAQSIRCRVCGAQHTSKVNVLVRMRCRLFVPLGGIVVRLRRSSLRQALTRVHRCPSFASRAAQEEAVDVYANWIDANAKENQEEPPERRAEEPPQEERTASRSAAAAGDDEEQNDDYDDGDDDVADD
jgi:transcription elongation factor Elf1